MKSDDFGDKISRIMERDSTYAAESYEFVSDAVHFTVEKMKRERHVTALELLDGIRHYAFQQFGPFYGEILKSWGITSARDIGRIVFALIGVQALSASENDSPEDFETEFDLFSLCSERKTPTRNNWKAPSIDLG